MTPEDERCADAAKFRRMDEAFRKGDIHALRASVDEPEALPNGRLPTAIGSCLVYAIYHSPLHFVRTLLELGADPNAPADDGFPPLIAALSCTRDAPGARRRDDVEQIVRLLLKFGADPNQRGVNDYTPLHMAVSERNAHAVQVLLDYGADPEQRTRIDDCCTALEMAREAGLESIAALLARKGRPDRKRLRAGLMLLSDIPGAGQFVRRQRSYRIRLRLWLKNGDPVRWRIAWGPVGAALLEDDGQTLITEARLDRRSLINGLFYGVEGMRIGGTRRLQIAPQLAYSNRGVPEGIPPRATLIAEITVVGESDFR